MEKTLQETWRSMEGALQQPGGPPAWTLILYFLLAGLLALHLRFLYRAFSTTPSEADSSSRVFPLLTIITAGIIALVKSSLALSLGLVGAFSIVRFRAAIKEPEELVYLFLCIAIGLALGAEQALMALLLVGTATLFILGLHHFSRGTRAQRILPTLTGESARYFTGEKPDALTAIQEAGARFSLQRLDVEGDQGQMRVVLERADPRDTAVLIGRLLHPFAPRATRCSKYVHACRAQGLILNREYRPMIKGKILSGGKET